MGVQSYWGLFLGVLSRQWCSHLCMGAHYNVLEASLGRCQRCHQIIYPGLFGHAWRDFLMSMINFLLFSWQEYSTSFFLVIYSLPVVVLTSTCVRPIWTFPIVRRRRRPDLRWFSWVTRLLYMPYWFPPFCLDFRSAISLSHDSLNIRASFLNSYYWR